MQFTEYLTDDNYLTFTVNNATVPNLVKDEIQNDYNQGMLAGVSVMMSLDKVVTTRRVYSIGDWMNEIGGYSQALVLAAAILMPIFQIRTLDKYLVLKLYKKQDEDHEEVLSSEREEEAPRLFKFASKTLKSRARIKTSRKTFVLELISNLLRKVCRRLKLDDDELHYLKARETLNKELDIKHFIKNIRLIRNSLKFLTTRKERHLVRMQADKNVVVLNKQDKADLALNDYELHDQSSEMGSDHYEQVLTDMRTHMKGKELSDREKFLLAGIHTVNIRQREMAQGMQNFFKRKIKEEMDRKKSI